MYDISYNIELSPNDSTHSGTSAAVPRPGEFLLDLYGRPGLVNIQKNDETIATEIASFPINSG